MRGEMSRLREYLRRRLWLGISGVAMVLAAGAVQASDNHVVAGTDLPGMDCVVNPSDIVDLGSAVSGKVVLIHVDRSDRVERNQTLVELESGVEKAALALADRRARLETTIELRQEIAAFDRLTLQRTEELLRTSAVSQHDVDKVKSEVQITALQVQQARDNKQLAELERQRAAEVLALRTIRSPVSGVVMERFKSVGEYVDDEPVLRIAQLDPLHIEVIADIKHLGRIVPGMTATVQPQLAGAEPYSAKVERVDAVADAASGTFGVRLSVANPDYQINAGMRCRVEFTPHARDGSGQCSTSEQGQCTAGLKTD